MITVNTKPKRTACAGALAAAIPVAGAAYQQVATARDSSRYPPPGRLVRVDGHKLHILRAGVGAPAVVFDAGAGGWSMDWFAVHAAVAEFTSACAYDRAGLGWSEPGPPPRDARTIARELYALLRNAPVPAPWVLVGHSMGGVHMRVFAAEHPREVVGLVLVDSSHPEQMRRLPSGVTRLLRSTRRLTTVGRFTAPFGLPRIVHRPMATTGLPSHLQRAVTAVGYRSAAYRTVRDELFVIDESLKQAADATLPEGLPLAVVTAGKPQRLPGVDDAEFLATWHELQTELAALSSHSRQYIAARSGHYVQIDDPDLVVRAIRDIVDVARSPGTHTALSASL